MKLPTTAPLLPAITTLLLTLTTLTAAATLTQITTSFGPNPTKVGFFIYVPDALAPSPPILVNPHWCHGTAAAAYAGSQYATLASKHGFIVIYPNSPNAADQCWDVSSSQTLTHALGGDSLGIISMVQWTLAKYSADPKRVFVTGVSSGGMMTNVLIGSYPDIFAAGSAWAGVPFGCFAAPGNNTSIYGYWNADCATGKVTHTSTEWTNIVKAAYPGYTGWRPKMQTFHGTSDETLDYKNFGEQIKEWTGVLGLSSTPVSTVANTPLSGWTKTSYGPNGWFEAYSAQGVTHNIQVQADTVVSFFGLDCKGSGCFGWGQGGPNGGGAGTTSTTKTAAVSTTTSAAGVTSTVATTSPTSFVLPDTKTSTTAAATSFATSLQPLGQSLYGQCGGIGYTGPTSCQTAKCTTYNTYYAQVRDSIKPNPLWSNTDIRSFKCVPT
ncbi:Alpha/Beta hydrolase protein [Bombardia bombarda]|uniref:Carboxylic ester hydrolase n=1 Tax=Bombardia bombarda TaxID=252184 RepID=A0AA39XAK1_9PEZI|nr:Alpha/Beta hydrolase protein [Bombardia bombarda]